MNNDHQTRQERRADDLEALKDLTGAFLDAAAKAMIILGACYLAGLSLFITFG